MIKQLSELLNRKTKNLIKKRFMAFSPKPYVLKDNLPVSEKFPESRKGGVIITADFELAWAVRFSKRVLDPIEYARRERVNVPIILSSAQQYNIPITWATVGHLFLDACKRGDHDWMTRLPYMDDHWRYTTGDWFDHDPCSSVTKDPEWYAPDLVKMIVDNKVKHEIACHTFSHIDCSDKNCPAQVLDDELTACEMAAKIWDIRFRSMAFPGGTAGNFATLMKHGIKIYRRRIGAYELAYPYRDEVGLLVSPTGPAIALGHPEWSVQDEFSYYKRAVDKAIKRHTLAHMWFHPSASLLTFSQLLPMIMEYCAVRRDKGDLWIGTMQDLQEHINNSGLI